MSNAEKEHVKVIILGDSGVGKSAIIQRYYENVFDTNSTSTANATFFEKEITIKGQQIVLEIWDTVGQEEYRSITKNFVKNAKVIILVYDITSLRSFESLSYWYDFISKEMEEKVILGLAGNKTDLIFEDDFDEEVSPAKAKEYAEKIGASFSLVSAKESPNEIVTLIDDLISKYLSQNKSELKEKKSIKLDEKHFEQVSTKNNDCCMGKNKKSIQLRIIFLGCKGVGKTSIIKAIKGNKDIKNIIHTKKEYKETIHYNKSGQNIIVEIKDTNGEEFDNKNIEYYSEQYKLIFLVFDIYKKDTLDKFKNWMNDSDNKKSKVYLLGYKNDSSENINSEFDYENEAERFCIKHKCQYKSISIEEIDKIKDILLNNINDSTKK